MSGVTTSATYYSDVRVPAASVVGELNRGWPLITNQLNHERVALTSAAPIMTALHEVREWASTTKLADGRRVIDQEWVQIHLARVHAKVQFLRLKNWQIASGEPRRPGRRVGHQGVRHRVRHRGLPAADGGARRQRDRATRLSRPPSCTGGSNACTARR